MTQPPAPQRPPAQPAAQNQPPAQPPARQQPSAIKLILAVALIVAFDILLFFAVGYFVGKAIL